MNNIMKRTLVSGVKMPFAGVFDLYHIILIKKVLI